MLLVELPAELASFVMVQNFYLDKMIDIVLVWT